MEAYQGNPLDPKIERYRQLATEYGESTRTWIQAACEDEEYGASHLAEAVEEAFMAAHFGALVLGYESLGHKSIVVFDYRIVSRLTEKTA